MEFACADRPLNGDSFRLPSVDCIDSAQRTGRVGREDQGENRRMCVGEGRGCRTSPVETPALLDRPSIRGVGVGGQLPGHSPTQTSGRAGDVDGSVCAFLFHRFPSFIFFFLTILDICIIQTIFAVYNTNAYENKKTFYQEEGKGRRRETGKYQASSSPRGSGERTQTLQGCLFRLPFPGKG